MGKKQDTNQKKFKTSQELAKTMGKNFNLSQRSITTS